MNSQLENSNQIVSDQGVRKNLYQRVSRTICVGVTGAHCHLDRRCVSRRLVIVGSNLTRRSVLSLPHGLLPPNNAYSERHEEEVREGVDGERMSARLVALALSPTLLCPPARVHCSVCAPRRYLFSLVLFDTYSYIWLVTGTIRVYDNVAAVEAVLGLVWSVPCSRFVAHDVSSRAL